MTSQMEATRNFKQHYMTLLTALHVTLVETSYMTLRFALPITHDTLHYTSQHKPCTENAPELSEIDTNHRRLEHGL